MNIIDYDDGQLTLMLESLAWGYVQGLRLGRLGELLLLADAGLLRRVNSSPFALTPTIRFVLTDVGHEFALESLVQLKNDAIRWESLHWIRHNLERDGIDIWELLSGFSQ